MSVVRVTNETDLAELVRRVAAGDSHAEEEVVRRYRQGISIIVNRIVQTHSVHEDICQETFRIALEKMRREEIREPERISGFICGIARNLAVDYARKQRKQTNQEEIGKAEQIPDPTPDPFEQLLQKERTRAIRQVISELKVKRDREVIYRYFIAEEDKDQICADLGLPRDQFNRVIFRALKRYKELYIKMTGDS
ncbi:MAG TPA: sigma-70 family RNA polymerase sigma factor [Blastocatellia bacterium]|nr:sigma-70 family RNA polymerase sigma factor [Blastocatellia bacterium]